ncbi:hypothetical protein ACFSCV_07555 [Methylopila henanensis]|uniref:DUF4926 domain-containing protein n=1 Tax=Methylopila henanensis TaxID=873516 RepID=A0ABW4K616_9HYPH
MKIGDLMKVSILPAILPADSRAIFHLCVGRVFPIVGRQGDLYELEVGEVVGLAPAMHSIWLEPEHLVPQDSAAS